MRFQTSQTKMEGVEPRLILSGRGVPEEEEEDQEEEFNQRQVVAELKLP